MDAMTRTDDLHEDPLPVREEIVVSWFRSARSGVRFDRLQVPYDADIDGDGRLVWAATPLLRALADDLPGTGNAVVLADHRSHVLIRHAPDEDLRTFLDGIQLAPGFRYGEHEAGTNAIGTALAVGRPFVVQGTEHFADVLSTMACVAVPVTDPGTGGLLGAIDLSCRARDASPLMLPMAKRAASEIAQRLQGDLSPAHRALREHFVDARRRTRDGLVSVSRATLLANAQASRRLEPGDHDVLWDWVSRAVAGPQAVPAEISLTGGTWVIKSVEAVTESGVFIGATLRVSPPPPPARIDTGNVSSGAGNRPRFGWASLTVTELSVATLVAEGLTNRQVAGKMYLSPHTVGFHLRQVFRKLEITSRVELARMVVENEGGRSAN
jgi:DNA-binding CsgD family transcriptional regulator